MTLEILTSLSLLLLVGLILTYLCEKIKISNILPLIAAGILFSFLKYQGKKIISFSNEFLSAVAVIALIMIVFDSTSRFQLRNLIKETGRALEVSLLFLFSCLIIISLATKLLFGLDWWLCFLFSSLMLGTDPSSILIVLKNLKHRVVTFLEWESIINTPLTVIIPFIVLEMNKSLKGENLFSKFLEQILPFLQQIITGVGAGVVIFLIVFKIMRAKYIEVLTPVSLLVSALLTYVLAEGLGGNGVLAVTALGLLFGNVYIKKKEVLKTFGHLFSTLFEILIFLLLGLNIVLPKKNIFYLQVFGLFVIYLLIRILIIFFVFKKKGFTFKEKLFIGLNTSKGVAVATVLFVLISLGIKRELIDIGVLFILYSLILSTLIVKFDQFFLKKTPEKSKQN